MATKSSKTKSKKPVKKVATSGKSLAKKTVKKSEKNLKVASQVASSAMMSDEKMETSANGAMTAFNRIPANVKVGGLLVIALIVLLLGVFKGWVVAAWVNGRPVFRYEIVSEMEKQQGAQILESMVTKKLIEQEAAKNNVVVTQEEVDAEITKLEESLKSQGQDLDQLLAFQNWDRSDLNDQFRVQKLMEKMGGGTVEVTAEEVEKFITENKAILPAEATQTELETTAKEQIEQQKKSANIRAWLAGVQASGKVLYWVDYAKPVTAAPAAETAQ